MSKEMVSNAVLQGGPGAFLIRPSSKQSQVILCINDNMKPVSYPVSISLDGKKVSFAGENLEGLEGLMTFLRKNPLESKKVSCVHASGSPTLCGS